MKKVKLIAIMVLLMAMYTTQAQNFIRMTGNDISCIDGSPINLNISRGNTLGIGKVDSVVWRKNGVKVATKKVRTTSFSGDSLGYALHSMAARSDGSVFFTKRPTIGYTNWNEDSLIGVKNGAIIYKKRLDFFTSLAADKYGNIYAYQNTNLANSNDPDTVFVLTPSNVWSVYNTVEHNTGFNWNNNASFSCDDYGNVYTINSDSLYTITKINSSNVKKYYINIPFVEDTATYFSNLSYKYNIQMSSFFNSKDIYVYVPALHTNIYGSPANGSLAQLYYDEQNDQYLDPNFISVPYNDKISYRLEATPMGIYNNLNFVIEGIDENLGGTYYKPYTAVDSNYIFYIQDGMNSDTIAKIDTTQKNYVPTQAGWYDATVYTRYNGGINVYTTYDDYGYPYTPQLEFARYNNNILSHSSNFSGNIKFCGVDYDGNHLQLDDNKNIKIIGTTPNAWYCDWQVKNGNNFTSFRKDTFYVGTYVDTSNLHQTIDSVEFSLGNTSLPVNSQVRGVIHSLCNNSNSFTTSTATITYTAPLSISSTDTSFHITKGDSISTHLHFAGVPPFTVSGGYVTNTANNVIDTFVTSKTDTIYKYVPQKSGIIYFDLSDTYGCFQGNNEVYFNVTVDTTSHTCVATTSTTNTSICSSALPYSWNGLTFTSVGSQTKHLTNAAGCDSAATLNLTVKQASSSTTNASVCSSALPYSWNGNNYTSSGSHTVHLTNAAGCDSAATLNLTVKQASSSTTNASVCSNALPYSWNGNNYTSSGSHTVHLTNAAGCDSAATLNLTVKQASSSTTNASVCFPDNYLFNGNVYSSAGTYTVHLTNAAGCDSAATLVLTVKPMPTGLTGVISGSDNICAGGTYSYSINRVANDSGYIYEWETVANTTILGGQGTPNIQLQIGNATGGGYMNVVTKKDGCYASAFLQILLNYSMPTTPTVSISVSGNNSCSGSVVSVTATPTNGGTSPLYNFKVNGSSVQSGSSNIYTSSSLINGSIITCEMTANNLCQTASIVTSNSLNIVVFQPTSSTSNVNVCGNQLPYVWNGTSYATAGTYTKTLTNAKGCDSVATLVLTTGSPVTPVISITTASTTVCNGNSVTFTASSTNGGSSPIYQWKKNGNNITTGASITFAPNTLATGDVISCVLTANNPCQTTAAATSNTITVTVNQNPIAATISSQYGSNTTAITFCDLGKAVSLYPSIANGVWSSSSNIVATVIRPSTASYSANVTTIANGLTNIVYTLTTPNTVCTTTTTIAVTVAKQATPASIVGSNNLCVGSSTVYTTASTGGVWSTGGRASITALGNATGTSAGATSIKYTITNAAGCSASSLLNVTVNAKPSVPSISFAAGTTGISGSGGYCRNKTFTLLGNPSGGTWSSVGAFSITSGGGVTTANTAGSGSVTYTTTDANSCSNSRTISANVVASCKGINTSQLASSNEQLVIYPNPAHSTISLNIKTLIGAGTIVVTDLYGKQLKLQTLSMGTNTIDVSNFAKGMYLVSVITEQGKQTQKIIVQ